MACQPPHPDSIASLHRLRQEVSDRGDDCLAMLLGGVDLYVSVGREWELLEAMRRFAHEAEDMVNQTPTAAELKDLFDRQEDP
jgi:hypothetical protein